MVEDDDEVAAVTAPMLEELGWRVVRAASGEQAMKIASGSPDIDLVFSDVMMPGGMNGVELALRLKSERPELPILLTSGYAAPAAKQAQEAGVALLPKPFSLSALEMAIGDTRRAWAAKARASSALAKG